MAHAREERLQVYAAAQSGLYRIEQDPEKQLKYIDFIDFYADLSEQEIDEFRTRYLNKAGDLMGLAQILRQEARQEGMQKGMQEGMQEGMQKGEQKGKAQGRKEECVTLVTRLARRKFSSSANLESVLLQLGTLSVDQLENAVENMLDWHAPEDFVAWFQKQPRN